MVVAFRVVVVVVALATIIDRGTLVVCVLLTSVDSAAEVRISVVLRDFIESAVERSVMSFVTGIMAVIVVVVG